MTTRDYPPPERVVHGRRVRPHAHVDEYGMVYDLAPRRAGLGNALAWLASIAAFGIMVGLVLINMGLVAPPAALFGTPQTTFETRPTEQRAPRPEQPAGRPVIVPLFDATPVPTYDNAAYNATAQAVQEAPPVEPTGTPPLPTPVPVWHAPLIVPADGVPDACASWHVPQPWPAECGTQEGWHAPLVRP